MRAARLQVRQEGPPQRAAPISRWQLAQGAGRERRQVVRAPVLVQEPIGTEVAHRVEPRRRSPQRSRRQQRGDVPCLAGRGRQIRRPGRHTGECQPGGGHRPCCPGARARPAPAPWGRGGPDQRRRRRVRPHLDHRRERPVHHPRVVDQPERRQPSLELRRTDVGFRQRDPVGSLGRQPQRRGPRPDIARRAGHRAPGKEAREGGGPGRPPRPGPRRPGQRRLGCDGDPFPHEPRQRPLVPRHGTEPERLAARQRKGQPIGRPGRPRRARCGRQRQRFGTGGGERCAPCVDHRRRDPQRGGGGVEDLSDARVSRRQAGEEPAELRAGPVQLPPLPGQEPVELPFQVVPRRHRPGRQGQDGQRRPPGWRRPVLHHHAPDIVGRELPQQERKRDRRLGEDSTGQQHQFPTPQRRQHRRRGAGRHGPGHHPLEVHVGPAGADHAAHHPGGGAVPSHGPQSRLPGQEVGQRDLSHDPPRRPVAPRGRGAPAVRFRLGRSVERGRGRDGARSRPWTTPRLG